MSDHRLLRETELLDELLRATGEHWVATASQVAQLRNDLHNPDHPDDAVHLEAHLDRVMWSIRTLVLSHASGHTQGRFRSPAHHLHPTLPGGAVEEYTYERSAPTTVLEGRLRAMTALPLGATSAEHVTFNSCMAALTHVVQSTISLMSPTERHPLAIGHWGSYFESDIILQYLSSSAVTWRSLEGRSGPEDLEQIEVLSLEPVRYNWDLDSLDLTEFLRRWRAAASRPKVVIVDTTLTNFTWPMNKFIDALRDGSPLLVIEVRSGLKLDQQGLELANVGVVTAYSVDPGEGVPTSDQIAGYLRMVRGVSGAALSAEAMAALDLPYVFTPEWTRRHSGQVFLNNVEVARNVPAGGIFATVAHPSLRQPGPGQLAHAPFTVLRLADDHVDHHLFLLAALREEFSRRKDEVVIGSSFGFRGHRCETIIPRVIAEQGLFKVAAGSRSGPQLDRLISVLRHLAAFSDMESLRAYYSGVTPLQLLSTPPESSVRKHES